MERVVLLNSDYNFLGVINWKRAVALIVKGKVEVLKTTDRIIRNASRTVEMFVPAVIRLVKLVRRIYKSRVPFSKANVITRDQFVCQYCGDKVMNNMTIDHVIPVSKGGKSTFENCVASCKACNCKKDDALPHECHMYPARRPFRPTIMEFISIKMKLLGLEEMLKDIWENQ